MHNPLLVGLAKPLLAGMPSPELVFSELGRRRWEELSFFMFGFLLMAAVVRWLWNFLRHDFPTLPLLSYRRSLSLMLLWGLLMTVVLALISGARELMTPGAWSPNGVTYKLTHDSSRTTGEKLADVTTDQSRRLRLENLRFALWQFASLHSGHFTTTGEQDQIGGELWFAEPESRTRFIYVPEEVQQKLNGVLVYEPEIFEDRPYVLKTNGEITKREEAMPAVSTPVSPPPAAPEPPVSTPESQPAENAPEKKGGVQ